jgi:hypothetical protein
MGRPIYVADSVMEKAGIDISDRDSLPTGTGIKQIEQDWQDMLQRGEELKHAFLDLSEEERNAQSKEWIDALFA